MLKLALLAGGMTAMAAAIAAAWLLASPVRIAALVMTLERSRAGLTAKSVRIPGFEIAYLEGGTGEPLLLLHGSSGEKDNWNRVARHLTPHLRVIALDLPGFGDSDRPADGAYGLWDQVAHIRAFAAELGLRRFHLGGHSFGGRVAAMYAARHPEQVAGLWLLAPGGVLSAEPSVLSQQLSRGEANPLFLRSAADFDAYLQVVMAQPPVLPRPVKRGFAARAVARADLHREIFDAIRAKGPALDDVIAGAAQVPARLVWGGRDRVWHPSGAAILRHKLPLATSLLLPEIGHTPIFEAPQLVAEDFLAFLQGLPQQRAIAAAAE